MAEKLFSKAFVLENNKIVIDEKKIYSLGISSARVTNACLMAVVKEPGGQQIRVDVQYNNQSPQVIDLIAPQKNDKISINITEELNCLIKFAFQYSGNFDIKDTISIIFNSDISLGDIDLFLEYIPEQIMHENSAYVEYDVHGAGNGKVNLATGTLRFQHQLGDVSLVYNDWQTEKRSTTVYDVQGKRTKFCHGVGKGFKLNVEQFLLKRKGTYNQSVYTYVDGEGNYHEFSEKYYYVKEIDGKKQKFYVSKSNVKVDGSGNLSYQIGKNFVEVKIERKTTNGLTMEQDFTDFHGGKYLEQRQQEQAELEENVAALIKQLKQYVIVGKTTGKKTMSTHELKNLFSQENVLSSANYERFICGINDSTLLLTETEAIQYSSLLLQQTVKNDKITANLQINSSYRPDEYYSDNTNRGKNQFQLDAYNKTLIGLRQLVSDLRKDYATLTKKSLYAYSTIADQYQYDAYVEYLEKHGYQIGNCCIYIDCVGRSGKLTKNEYLPESTDNLSIQIGHIKRTYCDLQAELERINDDLDAYYRGKEEDDVCDMKVRQKVVEQRLRIFQKEFATRTDKLQANINQFEAEINEFVEKMQGDLINRQLVLLIENSANNKIELEKYFKQYYNKNRELTQLLWQMPKYYVTGNDGVVMGFNKDGFLVALFDNYENQTAIVYEKGRISSIQDTDNNITRFEYDNKRISKIITSDSKTYQLFYEKGKGLLTRIVDENGEETTLGYDSNGFLASIEDNYHYGIQFVYDKYGRVIELNQTTAIGTIKDNDIVSAPAEQKRLASIDYHETHLTTSVTDTVGVTTTYNFDIIGQVVTAYEGNYSDPDETTRAKSFEYTDCKQSFAISDNLHGQNLVKEPFVKVILSEETPTQPVSVSELSAGDYVFSVWAKADSAYVESARSLLYASDKINKTYGITVDSAKQNRKFEVRADVSYTDETQETFIAYFDWLNTNWQYLALPIEIQPEKTLKDCVITLDYSNNVGIAEFDCLSLREGTWTYSTFDEEGRKLTDEDNSSKSVTEYFYDDNNRVTKQIVTDRQKRQFTSTYEYNAQGALVRSINYAGVVEETIYDEKGRELKKITYNVDDPTSKLYTESVRDDKGKVTADVDESGLYNSKEYVYQDDTSTVVKDGEGNQIAYGYKDGVQVSISGNVDGEESTNRQNYTAGLLTKVTNGETSFHYNYDGWGRTVRVTVEGCNYAQTEYVDDLTTITTLENGDKQETINDKYGNTVKQTTTFSDGKTETVVNTYDENTKNITKTTIDTIDGKRYNITRKYDVKGNLIEEARDGKFALVKKQIYTKDNELLSSEYTVSGDTLAYTYETDHTPDKRTTTVGLPFGTKQSLAYDGLGRTTEIALGENLVKDIYYAKYGDHATNRVNTVWYGVKGVRKDNTRYTYDKNGNILTVTENGDLVAKYTYDGLNRLVREDNVKFGTFVYKYDAAGNILSKTAYRYTLSETLGEGVKTEYTYNQHGWKDQLVAIKGKPFVGNESSDNPYDALGNPKEYKGLNTVWQGRRLMQLADTTYTYDVNGIRTSKAANNITFNYIYDGNNLVAEERVDQTTTKWLYYLYGVDGIAGFRYDGTEYLFRKNVQGDITHIYTVDGTLVAQYVYDAWGNCKVLDPTGNTDADSNSIGNKNPFRYRGYYYDIDNKLYYLQTRYYDPEVGRFINADALEYLDPETLGGLNLYAYCGNNPVMAVDPEGTAWWDILGKILLGVAIFAVLAVAAVATAGTAIGVILTGAAIGAGCGFFAGGISGAITATMNGENWLEGFASGALSGSITGALSGALAATGYGVGIQVLGNMIISGGEYLISSAINDEQPTIEGFFISLAVGGFAGAAGGDGVAYAKVFKEIVKKSIIKDGIKNASKLAIPIIKSTLAGFAGLFKLLTGAD